MPVADFIPNPFGGFAPFPNSIMIPFMGTQSAVLGYQFGLNYELGKRTIKAMDNDLFNKIVSDSTHEFNIIRNGIEMKVQANQYLSVLVKGHHQQQIDDFEQMIPSAMKLQDTIIEKSVDIELKKANRTPSAFVEILKEFGTASAQEVVENVDKLPEIEKQLVLSSSIIGTIYFMHKILKGIPSPQGDVSGPIIDPDVNDPSKPPSFDNPPATGEGPTVEDKPDTTTQFKLTWKAWIFKDGSRQSEQTFTETHTKEQWKKIVDYFDRYTQGLIPNQNPGPSILKFYIQYLSSLRIAYRNAFGEWI